MKKFPKEKQRIEKQNLLNHFPIVLHDLLIRRSIRHLFESNETFSRNRFCFFLEFREFPCLSFDSPKENSILFDFNVFFFFTN